MTGAIAACLSSSRGAVLSPLAASSSIGERAIGSGNASGGVQFNSDGSISYPAVLSQSGAADVPYWHNLPATGIGSGYWVRATVTAGTLTSGTTGSWLALSSNQLWTKGPSGTGSATCSLTFEFSTDAAGATIVSTSAGWQLGYIHS